MRLIVSLMLLLCVPLLVQGPAVAADKDVKPEIKKVPIRPSPVGDGKVMFRQYCAACHGVDAKGTGPAAPALKMAVADLTGLAKRAGGKFPDLRVQSILKQTVDVPVHGSQEMPTWGPLFRSLDRANESAVQLRIYNLTKYLESVQEK